MELPLPNVAKSHFYKNGVDANMNDRR